mmetsp:Transcript_34741/g.85055  ORF Transcript_34741/g.85055 Transcript_34741/m.85055 type:complete len:316 (+) Transcript_34741:1939-2886(+)
MDAGHCARRTQRAEAQCLRRRPAHLLQARQKVGQREVLSGPREQDQRRASDPPGQGVVRAQQVADEPGVLPARAALQAVRIPDLGLRRQAHRLPAGATDCQVADPGVRGHLLRLLEEGGAVHAAHRHPRAQDHRQHHPGRAHAGAAPLGDRAPRHQGDRGRAATGAAEAGGCHQPIPWIGPSGNEQGDRHRGVPEVDLLSPVLPRVVHGRPVRVLAPARHLQDERRHYSAEQGLLPQAALLAQRARRHHGLHHVHQEHPRGPPRGWAGRQQLQARGSDAGSCSRRSSCRGGAGTTRVCDCWKGCDGRLRAALAAP